MNEVEQRMLAHRVVFTLWPDMPQYRKEHMTPEVATYLFVLFERGNTANSLIHALGKTLMAAPPTSWNAIPMLLVRSVAAGVNARLENRGWALQSMLQYHRQLVQKALQYGPDTFPLALHDAFSR